MTKKTEGKELGLVIQKTELTKEQKISLAVRTPAQFIRERQGKGRQVFRYVEGGYVIARLNDIFGPLNWQFETTREEVLSTEVWVKGRLTVIDHKNGFRVYKEQVGQADRNANVPLGDTVKAAMTDALKKCASEFGIALDVYWTALDQQQKEVAKVGPKEQTKKDLFGMAKKYIVGEQNVDVLLQFGKRVKEQKDLTQKQKDELTGMISAKLDKDIQKNEQRAD